MDIPSTLSNSSECEFGSNWGESNYWYWKGFRCHWRILGKDNTNPLLLLHGFGASSSHWRNNAFEFASAGFRVYALDLIGFGNSDQRLLRKYPLLDNNFWAKQVSAFLEQIVDTNSQGKAVLVGNSLGGLTALTSLVLKPEQIRAVVAAPLPDPTLMQSNKWIEPNFLRKIKKFLINFFWDIFPLELIMPLITKTFLIKIALQSAYSKSIYSDHELQRIVIQPSRKANAAKALKAMCKGMSLRPPASTADALLKKYISRSKRSPILLIWGKNDRLVPLIVGHNLIKDYPSLDFSIIENSGHCPHDECPEQFNKNVLSWLEINLGTPSKA